VRIVAGQTFSKNRRDAGKQAIASHMGLGEGHFKRKKSGKKGRLEA
jgi:hypothetical protein